MMPFMVLISGNQKLGICNPDIFLSLLSLGEFEDPHSFFSRLFQAELKRSVKAVLTS